MLLNPRHSSFLAVFLSSSPFRPLPPALLLLAGLCVVLVRWPSSFVRCYAIASGVLPLVAFLGYPPICSRSAYEERHTRGAWRG